jgi:hypothetical protein
VGGLSTGQVVRGVVRACDDERLAEIQVEGKMIWSGCGRRELFLFLSLSARLARLSSFSSSLLRRMINWTRNH